MNHLFVSAAALAIATGLAHTILGEVLIFRRLRRGTLVPTWGGDVLREPHVHILWASWHLPTLLGWCLAAMLVELAARPGDALASSLAGLICVGLAACGLTVLVGTRGRHPGWLAMLLIAALVEAGR